MDPATDIYLKVATVSQSVLASPSTSAGAKEVVAQSRSPCAQGQEYRGTTTSTSQSTFSTKTTKTLLTRQDEDDWVPSYWVPRLFGVASFLLPVITVILGYSLSLGCRSCYEGGDSGVHVPDQFSISDTFRKAPTRWSGFALTSLASLCLCVLGWYRHCQLLALCHPLFPKLVFKSLRSGVVWAAFCFFLVLLAAFPPGERGSLRSKGHLAVMLVAVVLFAVYSYVQIVQVEKVLVAHQLVNRGMHALRVRLTVVALACVVVTVPLIITQNLVAGRKHSSESVDTNDAKAGESSSGVPTVGTFLMIFEFGTILHAVAAVGLTDFSSMSYNSTKLQSLLKVWKKSKRQINVVVEHPNGKSMREVYGRLHREGECPRSVC